MPEMRKYLCLVTFMINLRGKRGLSKSSTEVSTKVVNCLKLFLTSFASEFLGGFLAKTPMLTSQDLHIDLCNKMIKLLNTTHFICGAIVYPVVY